MAHFPTNFEIPTQLPLGMSAEADAALDFFHERNMDVFSGLTPEFARLYRALGRETGISDMCPNDVERFAPEKVEAWVAKGDETLGEYGRGTVTVVDKNQPAPKIVVPAFGWTGPEVPSAPKGTKEKPTPPELIEEFNLIMSGLGLRTTLAIRVGGDYAGQGLSRPLNTLLVHTGNYLYGATDFWLETWKSNHAGPHVYAKGGWEKLDIEIPAQRYSVKAGKMVDDVRTWYTYPNAKLPSSQ